MTHRGEPPIPEKLRRLCEAQNWRCAYCYVRFVTVSRSHDHSPSFDEVIPRSKGGGRSWANQVAACIGCNGARGTMPARRFWYNVQQGIKNGRQRKTLALMAATVPRGIIPEMERAKRPAASFATLREIAVIVPMSPARKTYFLERYGFIPGEQQAAD